MAKGGRAEFTVDFSEFEKRLDVLLHHVETGAKKYTKAAAKEILDRSLAEVPRATNTLARSAYFEILGKRSNFEAVIGYGGHGNPINPKTGRRASDYMVVVHEDMSAHHPVGKAKFLEDPIRDYQREHGARAAQFIRKEAGM